MGTANGAEVDPSRSLQPLPLDDEEIYHLKLDLDLKIQKLRQITAMAEARELATAIRKGDYVFFEDARNAILRFRTELFAILRHTLPRHLAPKLVGLNQQEIAIALRKEIDRLCKRYLDEEDERIKDLLSRSDRGRGLKVPARLDKSLG